jgi:hypothetical protein
MVGIGVLFVIGMAIGPAVSIILVSALISFGYRERLSWDKGLSTDELKSQEAIVAWFERFEL